MSVVVSTAGEDREQEERMRGLMPTAMRNDEGYE